MSMIDKTLVTQMSDKVDKGIITHLEALKHFPELDIPQTDNSFSDRRSDGSFKAAVFNIERGMKLPQIMPYLQHHPDIVNCDVILANELDSGMERTGNIDVTKAIAEKIGANYIYGVEYLEIAGAPHNKNEEGLHGNAIFSKYKLENPKIVRLPLAYDWYYDTQKRFGTRIAIFATVDIKGTKVGLVCVHLENRTTPEKRVLQIKFLLDAIDEHFGKDMPVIIGGDMNTNAVDGDNDSEMEALGRDPKEQMNRIYNIESFEPMLKYIEERGYDYKSCNIVHKSTRRKRRNGMPPVLLNLDWFFQRGLECSEPKGITAIFDWRELGDAGQQFAWFDGDELSDHDTITITCRI